MKKFSVVALVALFSVILVSPSFAENTNETGNSVTGFFKRLFNYPVKATKDTAGMTANTLNNTGEKVLSNTGENLSQGKVGEALVQPVVGSAETVGQTASETVQIPVKAAEEEKA